MSEQLESCKKQSNKHQKQTDFAGFGQTISWQNVVQESFNFYQVGMGGRFPQYFLRDHLWIRNQKAEEAR